MYLKVVYVQYHFYMIMSLKISHIHQHLFQCHNLTHCLSRKG